MEFTITQEMSKVMAPAFERDYVIAGGVEYRTLNLLEWSRAKGAFVVWLTIDGGFEEFGVEKQGEDESNYVTRHCLVMLRECMAKVLRTQDLDPKVRTGMLVAMEKNAQMLRIGVIDRLSELAE